MHTDIVILAAGQGTRMRSSRPKVLHPLAGKPLLAHVLDTARALEPEGLHVVVGHGAEAVRDACAGSDIHWVEQVEQLGTGHALQQAMPSIGDGGRVLILYGDVPLIAVDSLRRLVTAAEGRIALLTAVLADPHGYGRIVRDAAGRVQRIVEQRDADDDEAAICEVNTGFLAAPAGLLRGYINRLRADNSQREYYLTDVVGLAVTDRTEVHAERLADPDEMRGVNSKRQLAELESICRCRRADALLDAGVTLSDPARIDVRGDLEVGHDVEIDVDAIFAGHVVLGDRVRVGPYCLLRDVRVGDGAVIDAHSVIEGAEIGNDCQVGPFARIRPGTRLAERAKVGNFVETKKADIGAGSKVSHLSYVGDTELGRDVNVGAGTITCNYDGHAKHRTIVGDGVFIGSDTQLVAPVSVGDGATIGAGSTITRDVPPGGLTLSRVAQKSHARWRRPGSDEDESGEGA